MRKQSCYLNNRVVAQLYAAESSYNPTCAAQCSELVGRKRLKHFKIRSTFRLALIEVSLLVILVSDIF